MKKLLTFLVLLLMDLSTWISNSFAGFEQDFPNFSKYLFIQPESKVFFGAGLTPISVLNQKLALSVSIFQVHLITELLDFEMFNGMIGFTYVASNNSIPLNHFTFRTSAKLRITQNISLGPLIGIEFVSFPSVTDKIIKAGFFTPDQPFSSSGLIYGGILSESFSIGTLYKLKINQTAYVQTYSTTTTNNGWKYLFDNSALNADQTPLAPGMVFQLEFSLLY